MTSDRVNTSRRVIRGALWLYLAQGLMLPTGLITSIYLARLLGPGQYGQYTLAVVVVVWLELGLTVTFAKTSVKFVSEARDWRPVGAATLRLHLGVSLVATAAVWVFADWIALALDDPVLATYLRVFAIDIPFCLLSRAHRNILIGLGHFGRRAVASAARWISRLLLIILLVELGFSVNGALLGGVGASVVELIVVRVYIRPKLLLPGFPISQLVHTGLLLLLFEISMRLFDRLDLFSLKVLGGTSADAGVYAAAQNLTLGLGMLGMALGVVLLPTIARLLRDGHKQEVRQLERNALRGMIGLLPLAGLAAGASSEIVVLFFGDEYAPAAPLLSFLMFAAVARATLSIGAAILVAESKFAWTTLLAPPMLAIAIVGYLTMIPIAHMSGAAAVTCAASVYGATMAVLLLRILCGVRLPMSTALRAALLCCAAYAAANAWATDGFWVLAKLAVIAGLIVAAFFLLGEFSAADKAAMRRIIRRKAS